MKREGFRHGRGEPALLASMTQVVMKQQRIDPRRVFIAGLSAGGAMAAIVAAAYPEIFAAVGVHSGLPTGSASNVAEALLVMKSGELGIVMPGKGRHLGTAVKGSLRPQAVFVRYHTDSCLFFGKNNVCYSQRANCTQYGAASIAA